MYSGLKLTYSKKNAGIRHSGLDVGNVVISKQNTKLIRPRCQFEKANYILLPKIILKVS